jgi:hypothetical protein
MKEANAMTGSVVNRYTTVDTKLVDSERMIAIQDLVSRKKY